MNLDMARSEVFNTDCIKYMRSLPSEYFDLAVCDPPFGKGNDDALDDRGGGARFGERFIRYYKMEPTQRKTEREVLQPSETGGGRTVRRTVQKVFQAGTGFKEERGRQGTVFQWGGVLN